MNIIGTIFYLIKFCFHITLWLLLLFGLYVEIFDMGMLAICSYGFVRGFAQTNFPSLPIRISQFGGVILAVIVAIAYYMIYKKAAGFWSLRILSSFFWGYVALVFVSSWIGVENMAVRYIVAVGFGAWAFYLHCPNIKEKLKHVNSGIKEANDEWDRTH